ncbi:transmembrane protein 68-like isoform X4 [Alligator sinensis]|uniref:Transmembrane protein 68-like isoform X4 n=1 Tax=Alligator sinensis TaxID=38654 RepID=A0A1U7S796_ALLSI|nr:transmembrane protein 68-like isoform X4 [Alligator sinensis]
MISISFSSHILEQWNVMEYLGTYLNHGVTKVVMASILTFYLLPWMLLIFGFLSSLLIVIYYRNSKLKTNCSDDFWDNARQTWAYLYDLYARMWHGFKLLLEFLKVLHGTREECMNALKNGELVGIAPGGAREAFFSDKTYRLVWDHRKGFAHLAIDAKVPVIPMFTENIREAYRAPKERKLSRWLYDTYRLPVALLFGGLPVKFRTYIGEPIPYDPNMTVEELAEKTKTAVQNLIQSHQQIPGSMWKALLARFDKPQKID